MPLILSRNTEDFPPVGGRDVAAGVRCGYCQEPLDPDAGGRAVWEPDQRERFLDVAFVHERCAEGYENRIGRRTEGVELGAFLAALVHNLEVAG